MRRTPIKYEVKEGFREVQTWDGSALTLCGECMSTLNSPLAVCIIPSSNEALECDQCHAVNEVMDFAIAIVLACQDKDDREKGRRYYDATPTKLQ